jgi:phage terminase large subunit-like protein
MATTSNAPVVPATGDEAEPHKEQIKFLGKNRPYYGFISGSGAGKTFAGVYRLWLNATLWNPDEMGAIIVPDKSQFTDNIKPIMREFGLMDRWQYNSVHTNEPGLVTENNKRILILSADNERQVGRIKGKNLAYIWMDEEAEIEPRAREIADQRLRVGSYPNLFITTTPDGHNHTYDFFKGNVEGVKEQAFGRGKIISNHEKLAVVGVPSEANPAIDDKHIERQRRNLPDGIVAQEIEGQFVEVGSGILTKDMLSFEHRENLSDRPLTYTIGVDLGVESDPQKARENDTDYWAASLIAIDKQVSQAYLIDIHRQRGMSLQQGVEWLSSVVSDVPNPSIYVESNQAQSYFLDACRDAGVPTTPVEHTESKEDRIIQMSIPFERGDVKLLNREIPDGEGYDPRFKEFVQEWLSWPEGRHDDAIDAVATALENVSFAQAKIMGANPYDREED